jgi:selenocysteine lyase/cysteine desulfurase
MESRFGLACRAGLHCAPWTHQALGTLPAGAIRFSFGYFNTADEVEVALRAVAELAANPV